jgi:hypothetical protein
MGRIAAGSLSILTVCLTLFLYQNCGKAGFENSLESEDQASAVSLDPKFEKLGFPYDISVNQIAHMSCAMNANAGRSENSPFFSWRVGAFENGPEVPTSNLGIRSAGLKISENFRNEWAKVAPTYAPAIQQDKLEQALKTLPSVANMRITLGFRKTNAPKTTPMELPMGGESPWSYFLSPLSDDKFVARYAENQTGIFQTFPEVNDPALRYLDGRLVVPSQLGNVDAALRANYDASFLAIGFSKEESPEWQGPGDERFAYGKGFRVRFGKTNPHTGTTQYPSSDSMVAVEEYDLATGNRTAEAAWDCSYRFKIVMPADRYKPIYKQNNFALINVNGEPTCPSGVVTTPGDYCVSNVNSAFGLPPAAFGGQCPSNRTLVRNTYRCPEQYYAACPHEPYAANLSDPRPILRNDGIYHPSYPNRPAILHLLRRFLPADKWDINVSRGCVVPKMEDNSCYQSSTIVYDEMFFSGLEANSDARIFSGCGVSGQFPCAAYLTMCIRR